MSSRLPVGHPAFEAASDKKPHALLLFVFSLLATVAVGLRIWGRRLQKQSLMLNDHLIVLGLIFALAEAGVNLYGCCFPPQWKDATQSENIKLSLQIAFLSPIIWVFAVTIIRASIITLYLHLFPTCRFRIACYAALFLNVTFLASTVMAECLICQPLSYAWDFSIQGSCGNHQALGVYIASLNLIQDVIVVILPMPILWRLQMATNRKLALSGIFGIGIAICGVTTYRVKVSATPHRAHSQSLQDAGSMIALLATLETLLGIISACLPMMRPIIQKSRDAFRKRKADTAVTATSGTIHIMMRISQMLNSSFKGSSSDKRASSPDSLWSHKPVDGKLGSCPPPGSKADRVLGIKTAEIHVREDVDVESALCRD